MAGGGYRGILAAVPTAQNLRSAFRRGKKIKNKSEAAYRPAYPSSPLPQIIGGAPQSRARQKSKCGSGLAREGAVSIDINGGCQSAFASKPAPT
jgi:hypothetical protein